MTTEPAALPVTVVVAVPAESETGPRPATEPLPEDCVKVIVRPVSPETRLPFASTTRTVRSRVAPAPRSPAAEAKLRWFAAPATVVKVELVPVRAGEELSVAVTV